MISLNDLRTLLKLEGIDTTSTTDTELQLLVDSKLTELELITGISLTDKNRVTGFKNYYGEAVILPYYPVKNVTVFKVDDTDKKSLIDTTRLNDGVLYLNEPVFGKVRVEYTTGLTEQEINTYINPLLVLMTAITYYTQTSGGGGQLSSITEGNVSVSYDTSQSSGFESRYKDLLDRFINSHYGRADTL